ncbi:DUF1796 family putative cysteine peptidase [Candidatus Avelusimicrobium stercoris]|uniref:DUF1796 family putative cysteine peptidase n=1 Tax=Candidatus Avelusimicrobium stercoris TaxID=1947924 RepID=UPI003D12D150
MNLNTYDVIYSLGNNCATAEYLRKYNLRKYAGPFDWITSPLKGAPFVCILDHFADFLNFTFLQINPVSNHKASNLVCQHKQTGYLFFHDFFVNQPLMSQIQPVLDKYQRRVSRFENDLKSNKNILLVWYGETGQTLSQTDILFFTRKIKKLYRQNLKFLFIEYNGDDEGSVCLEPEKGVKLYQLPKQKLVYRKEGFLLWDENTIGPLFSTLSLNRSFLQTIRQKFKIFVLRLCSIFIINKIKRHIFIENFVKNNKN